MDKKEQIDEFKADHSGTKVVPGSEIADAKAKKAEDPKADGKKKKNVEPQGAVSPKDASVKAEEVDTDDVETEDEITETEDESEVEYTKADMINAVIDSMKEKTKVELEAMFSDVMDSLEEAEEDPDEDEITETETKKEVTFTKVTKEDVDLSDDVAAMFGDSDELSEEFKNQATMIFEAAVVAKVNENLQAMAEQNAIDMAEAEEALVAEMAQKVDNYLEYVVEQWVEENELAIDSGIRNELSEDFINSLRTLFNDYFIDIPEDKVDVVEELGLRVKELEAKLDEEINSGIELQQENVVFIKNDVINEVTEGLVDTQAEKLRLLAEGIDFESEEDFKEKLTTMKESYFPTDGKKPKPLTEELDVDDIDDGSDTERNMDPAMVPYVDAISKTTKR
tara:strand:- start:9127 stop:10311 length:1185 start_codon:yes stop_codon:yes gene_type:complete